MRQVIEENWALKQHMALGISNKTIEDMLQRAKAAGALAGKIAGAGGGGFLLLMVPRERQNDVFKAWAVTVNCLYDGKRRQQGDLRERSYRSK